MNEGIPVIEWLVDQRLHQLVTDPLGSALIDGETNLVESFLWLATH